MKRWNINISVYFLSILVCCIHCQGGLNPRGRNVCESVSGHFQCCNGWGEQGDECLIAICEGNFTCNENEVCVRPNECRCRHGYFGATCDTKCPPKFWGPDCKGHCSCHPNGQCDDVTGACTCNHNRWGPNCELACGCQKGTCSQDTGACTCYAGFWGKQCAKKCYCSVNSVCDVNSGQCHCNPGWYGRTCNAQCICNGSPCEQLTGRCKCRERLWGTQCERMCQCIHGRCNQADGSCTCRPGFRGKFCREPCPAGFFGQNCRNRCGHCKGQQPCKVTEGRCITCERGWNGTRCDQMCANGFFGENCHDVCPPCKDGHFCNRIDGKCPHCNPGWMGDRCEIKCPDGTYGDNCANKCKDCFNGTCHFVTGECLCDPGFHGIFCNLTCSAGKYGIKCAQTCPCHENNCNPVSGACYLHPNQRMGVMAAGVLVTTLLILLLSLLCCCCVCRRNTLNGSEKKAKRRLCGGFTRISSKLPCVPLRRQALPKVLVSHRDPENTFDCSFIEPPSVVETSPSSSPRGSYSSSAETTEDRPVHTVPDENEEKKRDRLNTTETTVLEDDGGISEVETLPDDIDTVEPTFVNPNELSCQKASESEASCSGSESTSSRSQPSVPQPFSNDQDTESNDKEKGKSKPAARVKPRPPDPSTKPKVSWIHRSRESNPDKTAQVETIIHEANNSRKKTNKQQSVGPRETTATDDASPTAANMTSRHILPLEHINGAVQNVLRHISNFRSDRKATNSNDSVAAGPCSLNRDVIQPHINSEAVSLLTAQLKEKTQSLNKSESDIWEESSQSHLQTEKKKPIPPENTNESVTSPQHGAGSLPAADVPNKEARNIEEEDSGGSKKGDVTPKKTAIKKPPRKKCQEGHIDPKLRKGKKIAIMPPPSDN